MLQHKLPYTQQFREFGHGEIRIGTSLEPNDSIYTFAFITQLEGEIIMKNLNEEKKSSPPPSPKFSINDDRNVTPNNLQ
jgi:hypothetical protein